MKKLMSKIKSVAVAALTMAAMGLAALPAQAKDPTYTIILSGGKAYANEVNPSYELPAEYRSGLTYADGAWTMNGFQFQTSAGKAISVMDATTIIVTGDNMAFATGESSDGMAAGLMLNANVEIKGSGTLSVGAAEGSGIVIMTDAALTVSGNVTMLAVGDSNGIGSMGSLAITGDAQLTARCNSSSKKASAVMAMSQPGATAKTSEGEDVIWYASGSFGSYVTEHGENVAEVVLTQGVSGFEDGFGRKDFTVDSFTKGQVPTIACHAKDKGYVFSGWFTDSKFTTELTGDPVLGVSYVAKWMKNGATVTTTPINFRYAYYQYLYADGLNGIKWSGDGDTAEDPGVLTLNGAIIDCSWMSTTNFTQYSYGCGESKYGYHYVGLWLPEVTTINVTGENAVLSPVGLTEGTGIALFGIKCGTDEEDEDDEYFGATLTVNGTGTLTVESGAITEGTVKSQRMFTSAINVGMLTNNAHLVVSSSDAVNTYTDTPTSASYCLHCAGLVNNGTITATSGLAKSPRESGGSIAVYCVFGTLINSGTIIANANTNSFAHYAAGASYYDFTMTGSGNIQANDRVVFQAYSDEPLAQPYPCESGTYTSVYSEELSKPEDPAYVCTYTPVDPTKTMIINAKPAEPDYLTFTGKGAFSVKLARGDEDDPWFEIDPPTVNLEYSTDKINWSPYVQGTAYEAAKSGDDYVLYLRGTNNTAFGKRDEEWGDAYLTFKISGDAVACSGNIETLLDYTVVAAGKHPQMDEFAFSYLFENCTSLTAAPALPATEVEDHCYNFMFYGCTSLTNAPALPATTLASYCYNSMFSGCRSLTTAPALPATTLAEYCYNFMFQGCTSLVVNETAPGKKWSIPSGAATAADWNSYMFSSTGGTFTGAPEVGTTYYIRSAVAVIEPGEVTGAKVTEVSTNGFAVATAAPYVVEPNATVTVVYTADEGYEFAGGETTWTTNFTASAATITVTIPEGEWPTKIKPVAVAVKSADNKTLTFYYDTADHSSEGTVYVVPESAATKNDIPWYNASSNPITNVVFDASFADYRPKSTAYWFRYFKNLADITGIGNLDTSSVSNMDRMFDYCRVLATLDVSNFNTANVTNMLCMFEGCMALTTLDVSNFDTAKVTNMGAMFSDCTALATLDVRNFDTAKVTEMGSMFSRCNILKTIYASDSFKTAQVTSSDYMFEYCTALVGGKGTTFDANVVDKTYARIDGADGLPGYFTKIDYLTFTAEEDGSSVTFKWKEANWVSNSTDGVTWSAYTAGTKITLAKVDDFVMFKGKGVRTDRYNCFAMTGKIAASGDVGTLTDGKGGKDVVLTQECYYRMFYKCASLTAAPALPATTLAESCYKGMFQLCESLTNAPALPSMTLAEKCYDQMFSDCTSLTTPPALPATNLADSCYSGMFQTCTALTNAPALPATNLAPSCYITMFYECKSLTDMPALPAKTLAEGCYQYMFYDCLSLIVNEAAPGKAWSIPAGATTPEGWNEEMFVGTGGTFTGDPEVGKTYYVGAEKEVVGDATLYRYEDKVGVSVAGELTKDIADTLADKNITNLVVGTGVTKIGDSAFASWRTLRDVEIGADCVEIGALAFGKCHNVTNIACAAAGAITIGNNAFVGCNSLEALSFGTMPTFEGTPFLFYSGIYMKDGIPEVYAMPTVTITGYTQVLKGSNDLKNWENVDTSTPEGKAKYHFFKIVLEAEY